MYHVCRRRLTLLIVACSFVVSIVLMRTRAPATGTWADLVRNKNTTMADGISDHTRVTFIESVDVCKDGIYVFPDSVVHI